VHNLTVRSIGFFFACHFALRTHSNLTITVTHRNELTFVASIATDTLNCSVDAFG
jgi:hypothetical protein